MNKSKIEWCDHTWNPITGCLHNCEYCYARRMVARFTGDIRLNKMATADYELVKDGKTSLYVLNEGMKNETGSTLVYPFGFEPTLHRYRYDTLDKLKMGNNIFVGAMADIFGEWVPDSWIGEVIDVCNGHPEHNYLFLTKNPKRYISYGVPEVDNMWYGTTITCSADVDRIEHLIFDGYTFVSIEPLMERLPKKDIEDICRFVQWIIIGAETGHRSGKVVPEFEWIKDIVLEADSKGVPVFMKDSLVDIVGVDNMRREYPSPLLKKTISKKMQSKLYDICYVCDEPKKKSEMITLMARSKRGEAAKQYGFMCTKCFKKHCNQYGIELPKLINLEEK